MKFAIARRWFSSLPAIEVELGAEYEAASHGVKLGAAVKVLVGKASEAGTRADLTGAVLTDAVLTGAVLTGADLTGADLTGAVDIPSIALRPIRTDFFDVLLRARAEVPALLRALREGRIDGSTYLGACACLAGTISNLRGCSIEDLGFADSGRPIERWFMAIQPGNTPENHQVAKITEGWIVEFMTIAGISETA